LLGYYKNSRVLIPIIINVNVVMPIFYVQCTWFTFVIVEDGKLC